MTEDKESKLTEKEREQQFMIGLTELTRKTGKIILILSLKKNETV